MSLYAKTKIDCENKLLQEYSKNIEITIFRPSTVYGHSTRMRFDLILNHLILDAYSKKEIKVFGPDMVRPLMWVGEPCKSLQKNYFSKDSKFKSQVFNMVDDNENYKKIFYCKYCSKNFLKTLKLKLLKRI